MILSIITFLLIATMPYWAPKLNNNNFHLIACTFFISVGVISIIMFCANQSQEHALLYEYNDLKNKENKKKSDNYFKKEIERMKNNK